MEADQKLRDKSLQLLLLERMSPCHESAFPLLLRGNAPWVKAVNPNVLFNKA
jgi:hypothetical protein